MTGKPDKPEPPRPLPPPRPRTKTLPFGVAKIPSAEATPLPRASSRGPAPSTLRNASAPPAPKGPLARSLRPMVRVASPASSPDPDEVVNDGDRNTTLGVGVPTRGLTSARPADAGRKSPMVKAAPEPLGRPAERSPDPAPPAPAKERERPLTGTHTKAVHAPVRAPIVSLSLEPEPTLLLVGEGFAMSEALMEALARHKVYVEQTSVDNAQQAAVAVAPDLIVLAGDAANEKVADVLESLGVSPMSSVVPVAIVSHDEELRSRLEAFRHGAAAVIPATASVDAIAREIAALVRDIPERPSENAGTLGVATLEQLVDTLSWELRTGILSVYGKNREGALRLVLGRGRPLADALDEFVERVKQEVVGTEPVAFEFDERAGGTVELLDPEEAAQQRAAGNIDGVRILLADENSVRADEVAHALRQRGAEVIVTNFAPGAARVRRLRQLDPMLVIIGERDMAASGYGLLRELRGDCRLRWASVLVVRWNEVWPPSEPAPRLRALTGSIAGLADADRSISQRADAGVEFDLRLESIGPARLLRALGKASRPVRVELYNPRLNATVDLREGLIVGAAAEALGETPRALEGPDALAAFLVLRSGRTRIANVPQAARANVLDPVNVALDVVERQSPPIVPSVFPEAVSDVVSVSVPPPPPAGAAAPSLADPVAPAIPTLSPEAVRKLRRPAVLGAALGATVALLGGLILGVRACASSDDTEVAQQNTAQSAESPLAPVGSAGSTAPKSLLERARAGESGALAELSAMPATERSAEQALALAEGRRAEKRREVATLREALSKDPKQLDDAKVRRRVLELTRDESVAPDLIRTLASLPGTMAPDILYEVWTGTRDRTNATELAEALLYAPSVRKNASPALGVALDLRQEQECDAMAKVVERAQSDGDRRALRALAKLTVQRGCGQDKRSDCYPCLRDDKSLRQAMAAVRRRPAPRL